MVVTHTKWHQNVLPATMLIVNMDTMTILVSRTIMRTSTSMEQGGTHIIGSKDIKDRQEWVHLVISQVVAGRPESTMVGVWENQRWHRRNP